MILIFYSYSARPRVKSFRIYGSSNIQNRTLFLLHIQDEKESIIRKGCGKRERSKVLIHEAQGLTFELIILQAKVRIPRHIHFSGYTWVSITRTVQITWLIDLTTERRKWLRVNHHIYYYMRMSIQNRVLTLSNRYPYKTDTPLPKLWTNINLQLKSVSLCTRLSIRSSVFHYMIFWIKNLLLF